MKKISALAAILLTAFSLNARDVIITVMDMDLNIPLEGAEINTQDGIRYISDKDGIAVLQVPDRPIIVQALYPGYETGRIVIPVTESEIIIKLRLLEIMQSRELVIEASRPGISDSRTGRSVSVSQSEIAQTAEIGIIEDVMSTIKLLPGVNYTGTFGSQPSIRGGHPGDMSASLDGFYINNPYFWAGIFSIFDPRMVQSAKLSHGVFSVRYGNTISGLLEISTKAPSSEDIQFEIGSSTSAANINFSLPLNGKGGIMFMGRITFYDPVIAFAKFLSGYIPAIDIINSISKAPYIRSLTLNGNYRFTDNLGITAAGFIGFDGAGANYVNINNSRELISQTILDLDFKNFQFFIASSLLWNPKNNMLLKFTLGSGYEDQKIDGYLTNIILKTFSGEFVNKYGVFPVKPFNNEMLIHQTDSNFNIQGRIDFDWELNNSFLFSFGIHEMINIYKSTGDQGIINEIGFSYLPKDEQQRLMSFFPGQSLQFWNDLYIGIPVNYSPNAENNLFSTSAYMLSEYKTKDNRLTAEIGLRLDHFYLTGKSFSLSSDIAFNPRINADYVILRNASFLESLSVTFGTGLFSSINSNVFSAEERYKINHIKPNRSWTTIIGAKMDFPRSLSLNIESYFKYIFNRMYIPVNINLDNIDINPKYDGQGIIWGIDLMLHKIYSRYWNGWISYSFNWSKYRDPQGITEGIGITGGISGNDWYFPGYHRFHNLNMVINYRPIPNINLYLRFSIASGVPLSRRIGDKPKSYPVIIYDNINPLNSFVIEKYYWESKIDEKKRTTPSLPMDIKFSVYGSNKKGKANFEVYIAVENVLALLYTSEGNTSFNPYTGNIDTGSTTARYDLPIPIPSFGFKISY